jgi:quinolinate synthase
VTDKTTRDEILRLKKAKDALILVHNYQVPEVQDLGDFIGDSLELARTAAEARKPLIVFCGVRFMAETAKILNPRAKVLIPREDAGCPMADMASAEDVVRLRQMHPGAVVCSYVNTSADVKAESDVCCTSANAVEVVSRLGPGPVVFAPDRNLASYVAGKVKAEIIPFDGYCYVHARFTPEDIQSARLAHPGAPVVVHPECNPEVITLADQVLSTSGMLAFARQSPAGTFIVATEEGLLARMAREMPDKKFYSPGKARYCYNMKKTRPEDVLRSLAEEIYEITIEPGIAARARAALDRMVASRP